LDFFSEGWGAVTTAGCLACRRTDHLRYNETFDGFGVDTRGLRGLRIVMDDRNGSSCHRDSQIATGHLLTKAYLPASGGRIEMRARVGFGTDPASGHRSADSFSCLGLYVHNSVSEYGYRNEISMCVSSADTRTVRMGYWVGDDGDKQHAKQVGLPVDLAQSFNLFSIDWSPTRIRFAVNDDPIWVVDGQSLCAGSRAAEVDASGLTRLPFEPMSVRVILRPRGRKYLPPPTYMDVASAAYLPAAAPAAPAAATAYAATAPDAQPDPAINAGGPPAQLQKDEKLLDEATSGDDGAEGMVEPEGPESAVQTSAGSATAEEPVSLDRASLSAGRRRARPSAALLNAVAFLTATGHILMRL